MPKKKKSTTQQLDKITETLTQTQKAQASLMASIDSSAGAMEASISKAVVAEEKDQKKTMKIMDAVRNKNSKTHRVAVDLGGGVIAQASTELFNFGIRALGRWSPDSWAGQNADFLQGAPHWIIGLGIYIAEMASRKNGEFPTATREVVSEASKLFSQLGFSNLVRALRIRYGDGKQKDLDMTALAAEKAELERRYQALQAQQNK